MQSVNNFFLLVAVAALFSFNSCKKDDPVIPNEEEIITSLNYILTPASGGDAISLTFQDLDGEGGNAPIVTGGTLSANTNYTGVLSLRNDIEATDISAEIRGEDEDHQFFFQVLNGLNLTVSYDDQDENSNPVGLSTNLVTGEASQGQLTIILRHQPDKSANGVAEGDVTNAGGETDIEVTFDITIQ